MKRDDNPTTPQWVDFNVERKMPTHLETVQMELGNDPFQMGKCPFCQRENITTITEQRASYVSVGLLFLSLIILGPYCFIIIPLISHFTADVHHLCPRCDAHIGKSNGSFSCFPKVHNDVITVKMGSCATIVSKKLLYSLTLVIGGLFTLKGMWDFLSARGLPDLPQGPLIKLTYADWLADCGTQKLRGNPLQAQRVYVDKWEGKSIEWEGSLTKVELGYFHKNTMLIEMPETVIPQRNGGTSKVLKMDKFLALIFDDALNPQVSSLSVGEAIKFTATILSQSTKNQPAIFYLHALSHLSKRNEIASQAKGTAVIEKEIDAPISGD